MGKFLPDFSCKRVKHKRPFDSDSNQVEYAYWDKLGFESNNTEQDERECVRVREKGGSNKEQKERG